MPKGYKEAPRADLKDNVLYSAILENAEGKEYDSGSAAIQLKFKLTAESMKGAPFFGKIWVTEDEDTGKRVCATKNDYVLFCALAGLTIDDPKAPSFASSKFAKEYIGSKYKISVVNKPNKADPSKVFTNLKGIYSESTEMPKNEAKAGTKPPKEEVIEEDDPKPPKPGDEEDWDK